mgnify:CR=1 FL=1
MNTETKPGRVKTKPQRDYFAVRIQPWAREKIRDFAVSEQLTFGEALERLLGPAPIGDGIRDLAHKSRLRERRPPRAAQTAKPSAKDDGRSG